MKGNGLLIIVNRDLPRAARCALARYGTVVPFCAPQVAYPALRGHADLFLAAAPAAALLGEAASPVGSSSASSSASAAAAPSSDTCLLTVAPNLPAEVAAALTAAGIPFATGTTAAGISVSSCGAYNVACSETAAIGNRAQCDPVLRRQLAGRQFISVRQGLARCSTLFVGRRSLITSDPGIHRALRGTPLSSLLVSSREILLPGYACGCFGGCGGVWGSQVFLVGSLRHHPQGEAIRAFVEAEGKEVVELYDGPLFDAGSIFLL